MKQSDQETLLSEITNNTEGIDLNQNFWESRWKNKQTGWDIGYPSPAITDFLEVYPNKNASILIPGCGNAYEAEYLYRNGFTDITLIDIAPHAVEKLKNKFRNDPQVKVVQGNFFDWEGDYDLMIEQTFFCAIAPELRPNYVKKAHDLLKKDGQIVGLLFNREFQEQGPPFGGVQMEYETLFQPFFDIKIMEECTNSIPPRQGSELFIQLMKK